ncbi:MAG TPA: NAD(P)H-dependent oxidoreductase [Stenotrophobium sp.]|jgi:multimeric flavodoxin WrbA|nr:NAD(P)H-dependent oxidoreductase [Stenotrophobium sp.]
MKHLLLIYSSQSGHTESMLQEARTAIAGEFSDAVEVRCLRALSAGLDDLLWAEALLIATPENFGYMSGAVKDFLDRTYYPAQGKVTGLPYAVMVSAENDGSGAVHAIERIAIGYGWSKVAESLIVKGELNDGSRAQCRELGLTLAAGLAVGIF